MGSIIFDKNGNIDWNANGWPEPNPGANSVVDGYSTDTMPDDIFDIWIAECNEEEDWGADG